MFEHFVCAELYLLLHLFVAVGLVTNYEPRRAVHLTHLAIQATFANRQFPPLNYRQAPNSWSPSDRHCSLHTQKYIPL